MEVGGLLLGYHDPDGKLQYAGNVGTGWDAATGAALRKRLAKIEVVRSLFAPGTVKSGRWSKRAAGAEHWIKPQLVAEVSFAEWTPDGRVRQTVFQGAAQRQGGQRYHTRNRDGGVARGSAFRSLSPTRARTGPPATRSARVRGQNTHAAARRISPPCRPRKAKGSGWRPCTSNARSADRSGVAGARVRVFAVTAVARAAPAARAAPGRNRPTAAPS